MASQNFTDKQLAGLERSNFGRWQTTAVKLIAELRAANSLNAALVEQTLRARAELVALDRPSMPGGRVLLLDCPASPGELCEGETVIYADQTVELCMARVPVGVLHARFDEVVEAVLAGERSRFRTMPGELSLKVRSLTRYPRDFHSEVVALRNAKLTVNVIAALNELRERMAPDETIAAQPQVTTPKQVEQPQTNAAQAEEQQASGDGEETPEEPIYVSF
jgi:hypothetical protein